MRRGFTLVEMLVALIVVGLLGQGLYRVLANQQRLAVTQVEQAVLQSNVRVGSLVLANELQELGGDATSAADLEAANTTSVTYRAMRSMGFACQVTPSERHQSAGRGPEVVVAQNARRGHDAPARSDA